MDDFLVEIKNASHDPLVVALILLILGALIARVLFRRHPVGRAITRRVFFLFLTAALLRGEVVPYQPMRPSGSALCLSKTRASRRFFSPGSAAHRVPSPA